MRRIAILGAVIGAGVLVVRARGAPFAERAMAHCESMFERMPDTFPPKKMMRGIEEIRGKTDQILGVLHANEKTITPAPDAGSGEVVHDAA